MSAESAFCDVMSWTIVDGHEVQSTHPRQNVESHDKRPRGVCKPPDIPQSTQDIVGLLFTLRPIPDTGKESSSIEGGQKNSTRLTRSGEHETSHCFLGPCTVVVWKEC